MTKQALRCGLPPAASHSTPAFNAKSPDTRVQTKWKASLVNHMFAPAPATTQEWFVGSKATQPALATLPMSPLFSKMPRSAPQVTARRQKRKTSMDARGRRSSERNLNFDSQRPTADGQWSVRITKAFTTRFNHELPKFPIGDSRRYRHSTILFPDSKVMGQ